MDSTEVDIKTVLDQLTSLEQTLKEIERGREGDLWNRGDMEEAFIEIGSMLETALGEL